MSGKQLDYEENIEKIGGNAGKKLWQNGVSPISTVLFLYSGINESNTRWQEYKAKLNLGKIT